MSRKLSLWSTLALLPATFLLAGSKSVLALVYAASFVTTLAYHASFETRWRKLDHLFAYGIIGSNTWMSLHAQLPAVAGLGIVLVLSALLAYFDARGNPERYDSSHALWHVLSGLAGACFSYAYV